MLDDECLPGTRQSILHDAEDWLKESAHNEKNVLWIYGAPGAGKSAIATTLARKLTETSLCAKVVAKRDFAGRRDPRCIWRTLAYNLARLHVGLKGSIMEILLTRGPRYSETAPVENQFGDLIVKALQEQQFLFVVAVIDGLDECFTVDDEHWRALLKTIAGCADLSQSLRLVVTSREIRDIHDALETISCPISLTANDEKSITEAKADKRLFFKETFQDFPEYWHGEDVIQGLVEKAVGSFIWAKVLVEMVKNRPDSRLEDIISGDQLGDNGDVDLLYGRLLYETLSPLDEKEREVSRRILATVILAKNVLLKRDLVDLVRLVWDYSSVDEVHQSVENVVDQLRPIFSTDDNQRVRIPHKSFADFYLDHERSVIAMRRLVPDHTALQSYLPDLEEDKQNLAIACLRFMSSSLRFNLFGIKTSHHFNKEIVSENSLLSYTCQYWAEHVESAFPSLRTDEEFGVVQSLLSTLLRTNALYWLEVLSVANLVPSADHSLSVAAMFLKVCSWSSAV